MKGLSENVKCLGNENIITCKKGTCKLEAAVHA